MKSGMADLNARWRTARRAFDARLLSERRLLIAGALALIVYLMNTLWLTPTYARWKAALQQQHSLEQARDAMRSDVTRRLGEMQRRQDEARVEIARLNELMARDDEQASHEQAMLASARDMRVLLQGLLEESGQLQVQSMRTLPAQEVKLKLQANAGRAPALYKQSMELVVSGSYGELVRWLHSVENLPQRVLWDGIRLTADERANLSLSMTVHTFSPDRDALEIAP